MEVGYLLYLFIYFYNFVQLSISNKEVLNFEFLPLNCSDIIIKLENMKTSGHAEISNVIIMIINKNYFLYNTFFDIWRSGKIKLLNKPNEDPVDISLQVQTNLDLT